jgi:hypothetical protein
MRKNPDTMTDAERRAWVTNGYSNHFLQDSFAAGHLINKTLVMQWFVEYHNRQPFSTRAMFGLPDRARGMTTAKQPLIGDRRAYDQTRLHTTASQDRASGSVVTDPQTTLERGDQEGRYAGAGVVSKDPEPEREYGDYAEFLNSAYINLAANDIHDEYNGLGLKVANKAGNEFVVGGDGTLLREDGASIEITLRADAMADQAIQDLITTGTTAVAIEDIFSLFPSTVFHEGNPYPLEKWNDDVVKAYCEKWIFPEMVRKLDYKVVRLVGPKLLTGKGPGGGVLTPP